MRGEDKLLRQIDGITLLRHVAIMSLRSNCCEVNVVIQAKHDRRYRSIADLPVQITFLGHRGTGMSTSLRHGILAFNEPPDAVMIILADMPEVQTSDLNALIDAYEPGRIVAASAKGQRGHPLCLPQFLFGELAHLKGDDGARSLIKKNAAIVKLIDREGHRACVDLNTPEDWSDWLAQRVR